MRNRILIISNYLPINYSLITKGKMYLFRDKPVCVFSCFSYVQLFVTLRTVACQAPLSMGFSRQEYWSGFLCPPPGDLPDPGIELTSPASQADSLPLSHPEISLTDTILRKWSKQTPSVMGQIDITCYWWAAIRRAHQDFPVLQWLSLFPTVQGAWIQLLVRELDPTCCNQDLAQLN